MCDKLDTGKTDLSVLLTSHTFIQMKLKRVQVQSTKMSMSVWYFQKHPNELST